MNIDPYYQRQKCRAITSFWQYKSSVDIRRCFLLGRLQTWVGSLKSTNLPFSRCYIFPSFRNNVGINCTLRQHTGFLPAPVRMTLNARFIKCAYCSVDSAWHTFVAGLGFDHTHRCSQSGQRGSELEPWGPSPPPCGQLTRCFSAVAELLVFVVTAIIILLHDLPRCINYSSTLPMHRAYMTVVSCLCSQVTWSLLLVAIGWMPECTHICTTHEIMYEDVFVFNLV